MCTTLTTPQTDAADVAAPLMLLLMSLLLSCRLWRRGLDTEREERERGKEMVLCSPSLSLSLPSLGSPRLVK